MHVIWYIIGAFFGAIFVEAEIKQMLFTKRENTAIASSQSTEDITANSLVKCSSVCNVRNNCEGYERTSADSCILHFSPLTLQSESTKFLYIRDSYIPEEPASSTVTPASSTVTPATTTANVKQLALANGYHEYSGRMVKVYLGDTNLNWNDAITACKNPDFPTATLFVPKSVEDVTHILGMVNMGDKYWIGLNDIETEDTIKWMDGTTLTDYFGMKFEDEDYPKGNDDNKDCVEFEKKEKDNIFYGYLKFNDIAAGNKGYLCEFALE